MHISDYDKSFSSSLALASAMSMVRVGPPLLIESGSKLFMLYFVRIELLEMP